jgi:hypothetical protein
MDIQFDDNIKRARFPLLTWLTSRQAFWDEFVHDKFKPGFESFELLPFSKEQVEKYWDKSFPTIEHEEKRSRARQIHARIVGQARSQELGAVPAVLALIAECADDEEKPTEKYGKYLEGERPLDGLIKYLCAREQGRRLPSATPQAQIAWLTDLALSGQETFDAQTLQEYAEIDLPLTTSEFSAISSHPLLRPTGTKEPGAYAFRFDWLKEYLTACWISLELGGGGLLLARPPDRSLDDVEPLIEEALAEAARQGVRGPAITPFVLARLHERSGGRTLRANRELIVGNAALAGELAVALSAAA